MFNIGFTFFIFVMNALISILLLIRVLDMWANEQYVIGLICLALSALNAYCAIDGLESLDNKIKEYKND